MGGTALSTWLLLLFSTQLKGECSLIWTRGEEKHSGTGIWQEGAGKQREERRGESGQGFAQGGEDGAGLEQGAIVLGEQGAGRGPPQTRRAGADVGKVFGTGFSRRIAGWGVGRALCAGVHQRELAKQPGRQREPLAFDGEVMAGERTGVSRGNFASESVSGGGGAGAWWPEDDVGTGQNPASLILPGQQLLPDVCVGLGRTKRGVWGPCWPGDLCHPMIHILPLSPLGCWHLSSGAH